MSTRVNINIPDKLYEKSYDLVLKGFFSNFSEIVREALRKQLIEYRYLGLSMDEKKLFALIKKADREGALLTESEMKKHGLKV